MFQPRSRNSWFGFALIVMMYQFAGQNCLQIWFTLEESISVAPSASTKVHLVHLWFQISFSFFIFYSMILSCDCFVLLSKLSVQLFSPVFIQSNWVYFATLVFSWLTNWTKFVFFVCKTLNMSWWFYNITFWCTFWSYVFNWFNRRLISIIEMSVSELVNKKQLVVAEGWTAL